MKIFNMLKVKQFYKGEQYPVFSVVSQSEEEYNQLIALLKKHEYDFFGEPYPFMNAGEHKATLRISTLQETVTPSLDMRCWNEGIYEIVGISELREVLKDEVDFIS